jgi:hypothetical protein
VQKQAYKNHPFPGGSGGAIIGKTVFTCADIGKILQKSSSQEPLDQKSCLHESFLT